MAVDLAALKAKNEARWAKAKLSRNFTYVAESLVASRAKVEYLLIEQYTGVPWWVIAVIHEREAAQRFDANIAQGDPWNKVSTHVPKGRGPFQSFTAAAIDALSNCAPYAARNKDWSVGGTLTLLETYNGLGYAERGIPSPYIWSGTDQYYSGKYTKDGVFNPLAIDVQLGCAGLIKAMMRIDTTIVFGRPVPSFDQKPSNQPPNVVKSPPRARDPWLQGLFDFISALFGRK